MEQQNYQLNSSTDNVIVCLAQTDFLRLSTWENCFLSLVMLYFVEVLILLSMDYICEFTVSYAKGHFKQ